MGGVGGEERREDGAWGEGGKVQMKSREDWVVERKTGKKGELPCERAGKCRECRYDRGREMW